MTCGDSESAKNAPRWALQPQAGFEIYLFRVVYICTVAFDRISYEQFKIILNGSLMTSLPTIKKIGLTQKDRSTTLRLHAWYPVQDDHEIGAEKRNIYGKCKSSRKIASNLLWWEVDYYSNDAAEALTSQTPDG
jgi:hypothetical protein